MYADSLLHLITMHRQTRYRRTAVASAANTASSKSTFTYGVDGGARNIASHDASRPLLHDHSFARQSDLFGRSRQGILSGNGVNYTNGVGVVALRDIVLVLGSLFLLLTAAAYRHSYTLHAEYNQENTVAIKVQREAALPERVLVTGAAGFIGFHLCSALVARGVAVEGVDNFNAYYDPNLKYARAMRLRELGVTVHPIDMCDTEAMRQLLLSPFPGSDSDGSTRRFGFSHVVNLAAQAGVRHSVRAPRDYVRSNLECFSGLLTLLADTTSMTSSSSFPLLVSSPPRLLFASSSSVYGPGTPVPFSEHGVPGSPGNLYAASKRANEMLAHAWSVRTGLQAIGLRFFTVYGPWGRPDMAVYSFSEKMMADQAVPLYNDAALQRDFTYVDDIVDGILGALSVRLTPGVVNCHHRGSGGGKTVSGTDCSTRQPPFIVYNLGHGVPENVTRMVSGLEQLLGRRAVLDLRPLPATELMRTWADIKRAKKDLGFAPRIALDVGLARFVRWRAGYVSAMATTEGSRSVAALRYKLELEAKKRREKSARERLAARNKNLAELGDALLSRWRRYANTAGIALPALPRTKIFVFYAGKDSPGGDLLHMGNGVDSTKIESTCNVYPECVAYTSSGVLKKTILPREEWKTLAREAGPRAGIYAAIDVHPCAADIHHCGRGTHCVGEEGTGGKGLAGGPPAASYSCKCLNGHVRISPSECIPTAGGGAYVPDALERLDTSPSRSVVPYVFFAGLDSPGGDFLYAEEAAKLPAGAERNAALRAICDRTVSCLGFNSNGFIKDSIAPPTTWQRFSNRKEDGLYVLDADYCNARSAGCATGARCKRRGAGIYACACDAQDARLVLTNKGENAPELWQCVPQTNPLVATVDPPSPLPAAGTIIVRNGRKDAIDAAASAAAASAASTSVAAPEAPAASITNEKQIKTNKNHVAKPIGANQPASPSSQAGKAIIHVAMIADREHYAGVPALINSIRHNTQAPGRIRIWAVYMDPPSSTLSDVDDLASDSNFDGGRHHGEESWSSQSSLLLPAFLRCRGIRTSKVAAPGVVGVLPFSPQLLRDRVTVHAAQSTHGHLASPANFARFYLADILPPDVSHVLYLDVDIVVNGPIEELWASVADASVRNAAVAGAGAGAGGGGGSDDGDGADSTMAISAVQRNVPLSQYLGSPEVARLFFERYGVHLDTSHPSFNAGVLGINLAVWRHQKLTDEILYWVDANRAKPLWQLGTQPPLLIVAAARGWNHLPATWNVDGLGWREEFPSGVLDSARLLHWTGTGKPWLADGKAKHAQRWLHYSPPECSGHGVCGVHGACICDTGRDGHLCSKSNAAKAELPVVVVAAAADENVHLPPSTDAPPIDAAAVSAANGVEAQKKMSSAPDDNVLHVLCATTGASVRGAVAALRSVVMHTAGHDGREINLWALVPNDDIPTVQAALQCVSSARGRVTIVPVPADTVKFWKLWHGKVGVRHMPVSALVLAVLLGTGGSGSSNSITPVNAKLQQAPILSLLRSARRVLVIAPETIVHVDANSLLTGQTYRGAGGAGGKATPSPRWVAFADKRRSVALAPGLNTVVSVAQGRKGSSLRAFGSSSKSDAASEPLAHPAVYSAFLPPYGSTARAKLGAVFEAAVRAYTDAARSPGTPSDILLQLTLRSMGWTTPSDPSPGAGGATRGVAGATGDSDSDGARVATTYQSTLVAGLGFRRNVPAEELASASVLSWDGRRRPWLQGALYLKYWEPYAQVCEV